MAESDYSKVENPTIANGKIVCGNCEWQALYLKFTGNFADLSIEECKETVRAHAESGTIDRRIGCGLAAGAVTAMALQGQQEGLSNA